jgi:hypothetical protein
MSVMIKRTFLSLSLGRRGVKSGLEPLRLNQWKQKFRMRLNLRGDYGLDVGKNQEQEFHDRVSYTDSALDKIEQAMQTLAYELNFQTKLPAIN